MDTTEEVTSLATTGAPELLNLRLLEFPSFLSGTGSFGLAGICLRERVAVHNLLPLLGPFERGISRLIKEECHVLEQGQQDLVRL